MVAQSRSANHAVPTATLPKVDYRGGTSDSVTTLEAWVRLGIDCGSRPSELSALCWEQVDLEADPPTVTWCRSIAFDPDDDGTTIPRETEGKTVRAGWRKLTISPGTVEVLREHRRRMARERLALPPGYWPDDECGIPLADRVFRNNPGRLVNPKHLYVPLLRAAKDAGIGHVTLYDLRHTAGTLIDEHRGFEMAAKALGHAPTGGGSVTGTYVHRRLVTVDTTCLDDALDQTAAGEAVGE
jgi:integrase